MEQVVYRIIDANFNRAREAIRMADEYCRFVLNCDELTGRAKQLRHELSGSIGKLDMPRLLASRDTPGDVGVGKIVENQLTRGRLEDCLTANCKRLSEALRVLAETAYQLDPSVAGVMEKLRYEAYTLEKDIFLRGFAGAKFKPVCLYVIISSPLPAEVLSVTEKCIAGGADCIQLRAKNIDDDTLFALATEFVEKCTEGGVLSIINDRVDMAVAAGADGVHLGQNDLGIEQVRKCQLTPLVIGKSTHSSKQLKKTRASGVTYVSLGPVFATRTKPQAKPVGTEYVKEAID